MLAGTGDQKAKGLALFVAGLVIVVAAIAFIMGGKVATDVSKRVIRRVTMSTKKVTHWEMREACGRATIGPATPSERVEALDTINLYIAQQEESESRNTPEAIAERIVEACRRRADAYLGDYLMPLVSLADGEHEEERLIESAKTVLARIIRGDAGNK